MRVGNAGRADDFASLQGRFLHIGLFLTILISPLVFIEPAPYEVAVGALAVAALVAGVRIDRTLVPFIILLLLWNLGGALSLVPVAADSTAVIYSAVSLYLALSAIVFACIALDNTEQRLATIRAAYILAALVASLLGLVGFFKIAGYDVLVLNERLRSTFKDPNVFGPFLVLPLLFLIQLVLYRGLRLRYVAAATVMLVALLLTFSRGGWANFAAAFLVLMVLMFVTAPSLRFRARILVYATATMATVAAMILLLLLVPDVQAMFLDRFTLTKEYDVGQGGRFGRHVGGFFALFDYPNGVGPLQFSRYFGSDPHNDFINAFYTYGWIGGIAYPVLVAITLVIGARAAFVSTAWQPYVIAVYSAYLGVVGEGVIVGTDHWRHYYLLLGLVWGLAAATAHAQRAAGPRRSNVSTASHAPVGNY